ncbi:MAG: flagellar motor protein MotB [Alphaproteobacteria bacterium]
MASDESGGAPTIVIKKKKKGGAHGHHGGAWKVAYADFVTAMMAFFLLMWLLNVTTSEQKHGIADYFFDPLTASSSPSGAGSVLSGQTVSVKGARVNDVSSMGAMQGMPGKNEEIKPEDIDEQTLKEAITKKEEESFKKAEKQLKEAMEKVPDLQKLKQNLMIDQTPEGLRIQIVDQDGSSMFPLGRAEMYEQTQKLLALVGDVVKQMPNHISVRGHTDGNQFRGDKGYNNWDLSADRANSCRRELEKNGVPQERIANVVGKADTDHLVKDDPLSPRNRRISIIMLRENPPVETIKNVENNETANKKPAP